MSALQRVGRHVFALASVAMLGTAAASAQGYQGAVRDSVGVVPGVELTLVNEQTNAERTVSTNEVGEYAFSSVLPGTYTVRAVLPGFKTEERKGLRSTTQQAIVEDFDLEVGALSERITVTADAPVVERATPTVATSLSAQQIADLPIFGRNTFYAAVSTPSVIQSGDPQFVRYQDQTNASLLSLGGGPRRGNAYLLEGVSITDFVKRPSWVPSTEAIADMRVQASGMSVMSLRAAAASLEDAGHLARQIALNRQARAMTVAAFTAKGDRVAPSDANFIFVDIGRDAHAFQDACRRDNVMVGRAFPPLLDWARISIGTKEETDRAIPVFIRVLSQPDTQTATLDLEALDRLPSELT